ncbi:hypothetical protein JOM56_001747, partial [Amanita muscaria]
MMTMRKDTCASEQERAASAYTTNVTNQYAATRLSLSAYINAVVSNTTGFYTQSHHLFCWWYQQHPAVQPLQVSPTSAVSTAYSVGMDLSGMTTTIVPHQPSPVVGSQLPNASSGSGSTSTASSSSPGAGAAAGGAATAIGMARMNTNGTKGM